MDDAAGERDLSALAIDQVIGLGHLLIKRRGVRHELERRARLVDIADRVVLQQRGRGVAKLVGIECRPNGESENLPGVHVLHHDGAVVGVGLLHRVVERASPP